MKKKIKNAVVTLAGSFYESTALVVCVAAAAVAAAAICSKAMAPAWVAAGWPSYNGFPKNIELGALTSAILLTPLVSVAFFHLRGRALRGAAAAASVILAVFLSYNYLRAGDALFWAASLLSLFVLLALFYHSLNNAQSAPRSRVKPLFFFIAAIAGFGYLFIENLYVMHFVERTLDTHHFGERFTSALDFLRGGKPFVTFFWPHGLHDTGLTALAFFVSGRADIPTLFMADAAGASLAAVSVLLLGLGLGLGYFSILILALLVFLNAALLVPSIGVMAPVLLSFLIFARAERRRWFFLSGVVAFLAHVYRIDYGVYGFVSVFALGGYLALRPLARRDLREARQRAGQLLLYIAGALSAAFAMFAALGWPGAGWYRTSFMILPGYLGDSGGFPYPLPVTWMETFGLDFDALTIRLSVGYLLTALGLLAFVCLYLYRKLRDGGEVDRFLVLAVFFSTVSLRTAFGRSALDHILQFSVFVFLLLCLVAARWLAGAGWKPWQKAAAIAALFVFFDFWTGSFNRPSFHPHGGVVRGAAAVFSDYAGQRPLQCSEGIFSRLNLGNGAYAYYDSGICRVKSVLGYYGIGRKELLVTHSASLLYPSLGQDMPTKYYCIGWAITEEMQRELTGELTAAGVKAVLKVREGRGVLALGEYDIPDEARLPVYSRWLRERFDVENPVRTPLGDIFLLKGMRRGL